MHGLVAILVLDMKNLTYEARSVAKSMSALAALRKHWPEYAIEAWALGTFMVSAGMFTVLVEHPDFGVPSVIESAGLRRALIGVAMGATAIALIYSPWGLRSPSGTASPSTHGPMAWRSGSGWGSTADVPR